MPVDKASGPNGFTIAFYQSAWSVIKDDFMNAVNAFEEEKGQHLELLNNALVVLLPKKPDTEEPGDYRPITLVHSFGKIVSKLLSITLALHLDQLIAKNQNAFIKKWFIHDNFKYVQRVTVLITKKKIPKILLKLNISKAFDTLSWPFLLELLDALGFS